MKIEKKKVLGGQPLSKAAKSAIAATLGMAAAFTLNACSAGDPLSDDIVFPVEEDPNPGSSSSSEENHEPLGGDVGPEDIIPPDYANSSEATTTSSETVGPESSSETTLESSSQAEPPASSSSQVAVDIPQSHETFSSSVLEALSSAAESSSSQKQPTIEELCDGTPGGTTVEYNSLLYVCPDHNGPGMLASMVTTFERTDLDV